MRFLSESNNPQCGSTPPYTLCSISCDASRVRQTAKRTPSTVRRKLQNYDHQLRPGTSREQPTRSNVSRSYSLDRQKCPGKLNNVSCLQPFCCLVLCKLATLASPCGLPAPSLASEAFDDAEGHPVSAMYVAGLFDAVAATSYIPSAFQSTSFHKV